MTPAELVALYQDDAGKATTTAREWVRDGEWDRLDELLRLLPVDHPLASTLRLAMAWKNDGARELVRMIARGHAPPRTHLLAACMAEAHTIAFLESIVTEHAESTAALGFLAELVSETALLGRPLRGARGAPIVQARLQETRHRFAALPWMAAPLERESADYLPRYVETGGSSMGIPFGPRRGPEDAEPLLPVPPLEATGTDETAARMEAVTDFIEQAALTGRFAGEITTLSRAALTPILVRDFPGFGELRPPARIYLETIRPEMAYAMLLSAGLGSIPYQQSVGAAESRRRAWLAMGELADVGALGLDTDRIEREVRRCKWAYFDAPTWFIQEYCDLGIAALRADGRSIALVMGTATD